MCCIIKDVLYKFAYLLLMLLAIFLMNDGLCLRAQSPRPELDKIAQHSVDLSYMKLSPNGNYFVATEIDEGSNVTLIIGETKRGFKGIRKTNVSKYFFLNDDEIILFHGTVISRLHIPSGRESQVNNVKNCEFIEEKKLLLIHYSEAENNALEILDSQYALQQRIESVVRWQKTEDEIIVFQNNKSTKDLLKLDSDGKSFVKIWSSKEDVYSVAKSDIKNDEYIVLVGGINGLRAYYVTDRRNFILLSDDVTKGFSNIVIKKSSDTDAVFLTLSKRIKDDQKIVSIWHGSKVDLSDYFYGQEFSSDILWYPRENRVLKLDSDFSGNTALGRFNLFLRKKIDKNKVDVKEAAYIRNQNDLQLWNSKTNTDLLFENSGDKLYFDKEGSFILKYAKNEWRLLNTESMVEKLIDMSEKAVPCFTMSNTILWTIEGKVWEQDIFNLKKKIILSVDADHIEILNKVGISTDLGFNFKHTYVDSKYLLFSCAKINELKSSYVMVQNGKKKIIIPETTGRIQYFSYVEKQNRFVWLEENYNKPPRVLVKKGSEASSVIYSTNLHDQSVGKILKKRLIFKGVDNEELQGSLFYPPKFDSTKKYPVVLWIYEKQQEFTNKFLSPTFKSRRGFSARLLLESGYLVYMPDINLDNRGSGISALFCINNALDELSKVEQVDMKKVALMGHSFGGYETNFIATQSDRFAAFISGAGASDLIHHAYSFNYNFKSPDYYRVENGQYHMKDGFSETKQKYINNNPLYFASQVKAPVLLWSGLEDRNVDSEESRTFFNALRKYRKTVVALFYTDEAHTLSKYAAQKDYTLRMLDWYEYFLKDKKDIPWINKQMKDAL